MWMTASSQVFGEYSAGHFTNLYEGERIVFLRKGKQPTVDCLCDVVELTTLFFVFRSTAQPWL